MCDACHRANAQEQTTTFSRPEVKGPSKGSIELLSMKNDCNLFWLVRQEVVMWISYSVMKITLSHHICHWEANCGLCQMQIYCLTFKQIRNFWTMLLWFRCWIPKRLRPSWDVCLPYMHQKGSTHVAIIWDVHQTTRLIGTARQKMSKGLRRPGVLSALILNNWKDFLYVWKRTRQNCLASPFS